MRNSPDNKMSELQPDSAKANTFSISKYVVKIVSSLAFGVMFYYLQQIIQPYLAGHSNGNCCERCSNILYEKAQPIYVVCAVIVFFTLTFFSFTDRKSVLKMMIIGFLIFQIYTVFGLRSAVHGEECTALILPRGMPTIIGGIVLLIESCLRSLVCTLPILLFKPVFSAASSRNTTEIEKLD